MYIITHKAVFGFSWKLRREQVCEGHEMYEVGVLLGNFWCKAIFRTQFALLLFLRGLKSSILSFVTGLSFFVKRPLVKNQVLVTYPNCSQTFLKRAFFVREILWENPLWVRRCLLKNPLAVIDWIIPRLLLKEKNFFEKDAGKLLTKTLSESRIYVCTKTCL